MRIWHVLENADEVETMLGNKESKQLETGGTFIHPLTFRPHVIITVKNWVEDSDVIFAVPMELVVKKEEET